MVVPLLAFCACLWGQSGWPGIKANGQAWAWASDEPGIMGLSLSPICLPNKLENRSLSSVSLILKGLEVPQELVSSLLFLPGVTCSSRALDKWTSTYFSGWINSAIPIYPKHMQIIKSYFVSLLETSLPYGNEFILRIWELVDWLICVTTIITLKKKSLNLKWVLFYSVCFLSKLEVLFSLLFL